MTRLRYKFFGSLLVCALIGFAFLTPANASAPSWVSTGKYAKYHGGIDIAPLPEGSPNYLRLRAVIDFNWTITETTSTARIDGAWNISFLIVFNNTPFFQGYFGIPPSFERIRLTDSIITVGGGYDLFGLETIGQPTNLWVENTSALTDANFSLGGRRVVYNTGMYTLPIPNMTGAIPVTKYYEYDTGALIGLNLAINISALGSGMGLGGFEIISFPVSISDTNIFPYAWNPGGDIMIWLMALGALSAVSLIFSGLTYAKKR